MYSEDLTQTCVLDEIAHAHVCDEVNAWLGAMISGNLISWLNEF